MSEQPTGSGEEKKATVAIRVSPSFKQQLDSVVSLTDKTLNNAGVEALEDWVAKILSDASVRDKAMANLEAEERALRERKQALSAMLGGDDTSSTPEGTSTRSTRSKK
ncbi:hypothetical protein [Nocardiopsis lambiniae]|uniref:Uncharacterized protein n=1 Tax=Nocardiopsis lambiniae TaxID=3075539 RepID=A0ABU2MDX1_9ACTN|nr:hypothetical protein [Nocardiopsis sp. DSM 44743]MDT0330884.1 hypothetical protein [Nocardiopsis sp. DSM 44743]